ncbi:MAG: L-threonylcarbamoyladenylate synthase [Candidatus Parcubacteria bacterium]|nr:L-threonylcarbamoyladenylate synthase [Candidatus Parcubacteria bacterium]
MIWDDENLVKILKSGGVAVMPTDTLYGIVGRADNMETVERIYSIRKRNPEKPCVVLIGNIDELERFSIKLSDIQKNIIKNYWTEPTSIILDCTDERFSYLHRGTQTLAFRLPLNLDLQKLLQETGPLIAPSANPEGLPPAQSIVEAKNYFGDLVDPVRSRPREASATVTLGRPASNGVDLYVDGGDIVGKASKIIKLQKDGSIDILRE